MACILRTPTSTAGQRIREGEGLMEKEVVCTSCGKAFRISGHHAGMREVPQDVKCPRCKGPNEVMWPIDAGFTKYPIDR